MIIQCIIQLYTEGKLRLYMKNNKLFQLFISTLYLSAFTFGGGYVIITLMKKKFVDTLHWIDQDEMLDLVAIAQSSPGAIAVNGAIVIGYKIAGIPGMTVSIIGTIIPPFLIITFISMFYSFFQSQIYVKMILDGMQAGVGAIICCVVYEMSKDVVKTKDKMNIMIMIAAFILTYFLEVNVIYVVLISIAIGVIKTLVRNRGDQ